MNKPQMEIMQVLDLQTSPSPKKTGLEQKKTASTPFKNKLRKTGPRFTIKKNLHIKPQDIRLRNLEWVPEAELHTARDCLGITSVNGRIYAIGGRTSIGNDSLFQKEASLVDAYDPSTKTWVTKEAMLYPHAGNAAATGSDDKIYSFGGYIKMTENNYNDPRYKILAASGSISNIVQQYDPSKNTNAWSLKPPMPRERVFHAAVSTADGFIYVFGGYGIERTWPDPSNPSEKSSQVIKLNKTDKYNVQTDTWADAAPMQTPRSGPAAVLGKDGLIYVMGGLGENCQWLPTVEAYNPAEDSWEQKTDMPTPRGAFSAVIDNEGKIYAIGGVCEHDSTDTVDIYDPASDAWETGTSILVDRLSHGAVTTDQNIIYVVGGSQHNKSAGIKKLLSSVISSSL
ncbi:MAG: hypothetical protein MI684_07135 [Chlorobiales bacterium]|nr:hypothetical protein [Chlorobiales bacterium]